MPGYKAKGLGNAVPSDAPTALIAPSDYKHIYAGDAEQKQNERPPMQVNSDCPTVCVAPSDYQNLMDNRAQPKVRPSQPLKKTAPRAPPMEEKIVDLPSDCPTALIAPDDYENLFSVNKKTKSPMPSRQKTPHSQSPKGKVPTFSRHQQIKPIPEGMVRAVLEKGCSKQDFNQEADVSMAPDSQAPTALIAPADYENLFSAKRGGAKTPEPASVASRKKTPHRSPGRSGSRRRSPRNKGETKATGAGSSSRKAGISTVPSDVPTTLVQQIQGLPARGGSKPRSRNKGTPPRMETYTPNANQMPGDYENPPPCHGRKPHGHDPPTTSTTNDEPTDFDAPSDYKNYYANTNRESNSRRHGADTSIPSDCPTTLVKQIKKKDRRHVDWSIEERSGGDRRRKKQSSSGCCNCC